LDGIVEEVEIRHFHFYCGLGGGALGFNRGRAEVNNLRARFRCIGGIDVSPASIRDFERLTGTRGTVLDLFDREQYRAFHEAEPPLDWREATIADIHRAAGYERPHIVFLSAPCKGFSGLLSETRSLTGKYQALNRLTLRGVWMMLEAWADDPPELIIFENVPRIATRGRALLDKIGQLLNRYGYAVAETFHDCGEIGELAQSRKRFLLVARHAAKVPAFLYEPPKRRLRAVGEILERLPMPGDMRGGPMHSIPNLQWKTWVRLAFVEAGSDWRSLNKLKVVDGKLADYLLVPELRNDTFGVKAWDGPMGTITGDARPMKGAFSVADPRHPLNDFSALSVERWDESSHVITGQRAGNNLFISDPRIDGVRHNNVLRVAEWDGPSPSVTGGGHPSSGGICVSDPRTGYTDAHKNVYRIVRWDEASQTISSGHGPSSGGMSVADPRFPNEQGQHSGKYSVQPWDGHSSTITGSDRIGSGALCVADPRPAAQRSKGDAYLTNGNYGVVPWDEACGAVSAAASHDNGRWNVADPRLPEASEKLVAIIRALDGTWHRPFTTLELAALQSLIDPEDMFDLDGNSDSAKRERIGNAVPPAAAQAIADLMGQTLLLVWSGQTFALSATPVWVQPIAIALSVKTPEVLG
jgi:site-specific DNA-cytosine methylase